MPRPKTMIAMGLIQVALFGGLTLRGLDEADSTGTPGAIALRTEATAPAPSAARNADPGISQDAALARPAGATSGNGALCGAATDALRCRTSRD